MKYYIILLLIILTPNIGNGQAEKQAPYILGDDALFNTLLNEKVSAHSFRNHIMRIAQNDTLPIIEVSKNGLEYYIECFVNGKLGYIQYIGQSLTSDDLNEMIKNQKKRSFKRKVRIKLAMEYDNIKRNKENLELKTVPIYKFMVNGEMDICNISGEKIGKRSFKKEEQIAIYSYINEARSGFYKAIFNNEDIIIPQFGICNYIEELCSTDDSDKDFYRNYLNERLYLEENSRYLLAKHQLEESIKEQDNLNEITKQSEATIIENEKNKPITISTDIKADRSIEFTDASNSSSFERKSTTIPHISKINYGVLEDAKEWYLSDSKQWELSDKSIIYNLRLLEYKNNKYMILMLINGRRKSSCYIFDINQLSKFNKLKDKEINKIEIPARLYFTSNIYYYANNRNLEELERDIIKRLSNDQRSFYDLNITMVPFKDKGIVRFIVHNYEYPDKDDNFYSMIEINADITSIYTETTLENFNKFIKIGFR